MEASLVFPRQGDLCLGEVVRCGRVADRQMGFGVQGYHYAIDMVITNDRKFPKRDEPRQ